MNDDDRMPRHERIIYAAMAGFSAILAVVAIL